jgi:hypothetical protein
MQFQINFIQLPSCTKVTKNVWMYGHYHKKRSFFNCVWKLGSNGIVTAKYRKYCLFLESLPNMLIICKSKHKNLSMAWVDYQKAYDSVPHSWLIQCLQLHGISPVLCRFLSCVMKSWRTSMVLTHENGTIKTRLMQIRQGIF